MKRKIWKIYAFTKQIFVEFGNASGMKFSAALSYYTVFALAPVIVVILSICGILFGQESTQVQEQLFSQIEQMVGTQAAGQVQDLIKNVHHSGNGFFATIVSSSVLVVAATGIFGEIQDSINKIWGLRSKPKKAWWKLLLNRLISFSLILSVGFMLMISLLMNALVAVLSDYLQRHIPGSGLVFVNVMNQLLSFIITAIIFSMIFKILPDAKIAWKDVIKGAVLTTILFTLGKWGIGIYVGKSNLNNVYGAAASIIILMVWVYYSAIILYMGATFTKVYCRHYGGRIIPNQYAVWITTKEVETKKLVIKTDINEQTINKL